MKIRREKSALPVVLSPEQEDILKGAMVIADSVVIISTPEEADRAMKDVKVIRGHIRQITGISDSMIHPLKESIDKIKGFFEGYLRRLWDAEGNIKKALGDYQAEIRRQEEEARAALKEASEDETSALAGMLEHVDIKSAPTPKGLSSRSKWSAQFQEGMDEEKCVRLLIQAIHEYKIPIEAIYVNWQWMGQQAREKKGDFKVPGFMAKEDHTTVVRG